MTTSITPPAVPIKVPNGYHATGVLPGAEPATLTPAAYPGAEQAVVAASLLARNLPGGTHHREGTTSSYAVLASGADLYVTPLWYKNGMPDGTRIGFDVDWVGSMTGGNEGRGTASRATDPILRGRRQDAMDRGARACMTGLAPRGTLIA